MLTAPKAEGVDWRFENALWPNTDVGAVVLGVPKAEGVVVVVEAGAGAPNTDLAGA